MQLRHKIPHLTLRTLKRAVRWLVLLMGVALALILISAAILRFVIFPNIDQYKDELAQFASQKMQRKVTIGQILTGWHHISPRVTLKEVFIYDEQNRPALRLNQIDTTLSWLSLGLMDIKLSELTFHRPELVIRRSKDNIFYVAGINMSGRGNPELANWALAQSNISIEKASIQYIDELREAPLLSLSNLDFSLKNSAWRSLLGRHQFSVRALPSLGTKQPVSVEGYFIGRDISKMQKWHGEIVTKLRETSLAAWKPWVTYPIDILTGEGDAEAQLEFSGDTIEKVESRIKLRNVQINHPKQTTPLIAEFAEGTIGWSNFKQTRTISAKQLNLKMNTGLEVKNATGMYSRSTQNNNVSTASKLTVDSIHLDTLHQTLGALDLPTEWQAYLDGLSPQGEISALNIAFSGSNDPFQHYSISARFDELGVQAYDQIPGAKGISGRFSANENNGQLLIDSNNAVLDFPQILRWPIEKTAINGEIQWKITHRERVQIISESLKISNPHISGTLKWDYEIPNNQSHRINLTGDFERGDAKFARFYFPSRLGEDTLHWLDTSILEGELSDIHLTLKGDLDKFPFVSKSGKPDPNLGMFKVTSKIQKAKIDYGEGWPMIENLTATMLFEGTRMEVNATQGQIMGTRILQTQAVIPQLDADWPILRCISDAEGDIGDGIRFINSSPVKQVTMGFTDHLKASGSAKLHLELSIPLQDSEKSLYKGAYQISHGILFKDETIGLPQLNDINGTLRFDEHGLYADRITTNALGGPAHFDLKSGENRSIHIQASGTATSEGLQDYLALPILNKLQGSTEWLGTIDIAQPTANIRITSNLQGMAIQLPMPFEKPAETARSLIVEKNQLNNTTDQIKTQLGDEFKAIFERTEQNQQYHVERAEIAFNVPLPDKLPQKGIHINAKLTELDADQWLKVFAPLASNDQAEKNVASAQMEGAFFDLAHFEITKLKLLDRHINHLKLAMVPEQNSLKMKVSSDEILGDVEWNHQNNGKITAYLKKLWIPDSSNTNSLTQKNEIRKLDRQYPALDITADSFELGKKKLGKLELNAYENGDSWVIQKLNLQTPDMLLRSEGTWHNWNRNPNTFLKFTMTSTDIGNTLIAFGQPNLIKGGEANLSGLLQWPGSPHEFDAAGLNGNFKMNAEKGQIVKAQPGVGRLLGLLSLQSLPRRLTLDFRDLFSEGFAFDSITASASVTNGVLKSNDFFMTGPAAEAKIKGETNLKTETQHLKILVKPHVSDTLSLAALAGGPIAGAAAFVAQKLLKDPLNKIASSEYIITGTWDNPQEVESKQEQKPKNTSDSPLQ